MPRTSACPLSALSATEAATAYSFHPQPVSISVVIPQISPLTREVYHKLLNNPHFLTIFVFRDNCMISRNPVKNNTAFQIISDIYYVSFTLQMRKCHAKAKNNPAEAGFRHKASVIASCSGLCHQIATTSSSCQSNKSSARSFPRLQEIRGDGACSFP